MGILFSLILRGFCNKVDEAKDISRKIDDAILAELKNEPDEIELLLLGSAESGKSTVLKQMRIIHQSDYTLEEKMMFKPIVFANTIQSMSIILHAVERLGNIFWIDQLSYVRMCKKLGKALTTIINVSVFQVSV